MTSSRLLLRDHIMNRKSLILPTPRTAIRCLNRARCHLWFRGKTDAPAQRHAAPSDDPRQGGMLTRRSGSRPGSRGIPLSSQQSLPPAPPNSSPTTTQPQPQTRALLSPQPQPRASTSVPSHNPRLYSVPIHNPQPLLRPPPLPTTSSQPPASTPATTQLPTSAPPPPTPPLQRGDDSGPSAGQ